MILAISGQALAPVRSLPEILALFNQLGVRWIELWPGNLEGGNAGLAGREYRYEGRDLSAAEAALNAHGIGVSCVTMPGAFSSELVADAEDFLAALQKAIDVAVALHSNYVNTYCYHFALSRGAPIERLVQVLRPAANYAAERGVTLVLENEAHDASGTVNGMLRILDAVESAAMKTNYDPTNYYQAGEEAYPHAYDRLKERVAYVHLKGGCIYDHSLHREAWKGGDMIGRIGETCICYPPLPESAVNVERLVTRLHQDHYNGFCTLEPHVPPELVEEYYRIEVPFLRRRGVN